MSTTTRCRSMAPLDSCQVCSHTEDLHTSFAEPSTNARRTKRKQTFSVWHLAFRTSDLLEVEGSVRTARQGSAVKDAEDRKIDRVVSELGRYGAVVGALQETKWFGDEMYKVGESAWS